MEKQTIKLDYERETKRKVLYTTEAFDAPISNVYITKAALGEVYPDTIKVTIEEASE